MSELSIKKEHNVKEEKRGSGGRMTTESIDQSTTSAAERPKVILPRQLESVPKTTEFPSERHRWNTNEEVAAILIAFDKHKEWQNKEVRQRPPSGSMLLYSRKMGRYRKDGYCWKKRKDGKTTREDHMKLKVQGVECIYGCYVHSAILPTFHRRCYWLLQNPDIVLVHYLNVPYNDDNKLSIPTLSHCTEKKEWTKEELTNQLRPMFTSASQLASSNVTKQMTDDTVESIVQQLLEHQKKRQEEQECTCNGSGSCDKPSCKAAKCQMISPKSEPQTTAIPQNHLMTLVNTRRQGDRGLTTGSTNVIINSTSQGTNRQMAPTGPLILNLSQLHGSNGVIILSSQAPAPISIINSVATATATATQVTSTKPIQTHHAQGQVPGQGQGDIQGQTADFSDVKREEGIASCDIPKTDILVQGQAPNLSSPNGQCVSHPHVGGPSTQMTSGGAAEVGHNSQEQQEVSMDTSQQVEPLASDSTAILPEQKSPMVEDLVAELNMKNELHNFDQGLQLSQEEIQKTLSANLPSNSQLSQNGLANQNNGSIDSMEAMRTSMVSPQSTDLNFDAFDIFSFPDFDGENLNSDMTHSHNSCTSTSTLTHSTASTTPAAAISCASCLSNQKGHDIKNEPRAGIANITDFSPEWAYPEGGVKVLVTGPWYSTTSPYTVLFDNVRVPASLVQSGVLRCFCPTHEPGLVTLQVACEGYVISNSCVFEYKSKETTVPGKQQQWFQIEDDHLKLAILERLEEIEKRLTPSQASLALKGDIRNNKSGGTHSVFEDRLIECCDHLSHMTWVKGSDLIRSPCRMTLLHLAAALGYSRLISHLVKWRTENPSLVLEYEVDGLSIDDQACTPLMWACARGQQEAAILLYQWNANALNVCNKDGLLPAMAAQNNGHFELVQRLQQTEIACATHLKSGEIEATQPPQEDATVQDSGTFRVDSPMQNIGSPITQPQSPETFPRSPVPVNLQDFSLPAQTDLRANSPPQNWSNMDLTIEIPPPPPYPGDSKWMKTKDGSFVPPRQSTPVKTKSGATARRQKLLKRISVEVLPDFPQTNIEGEKQGEDSPEVRNNESLSLLHGSEVKGHGMRAVSSDPHLSSTMNPILFEDNPMISVTDPDPNSLMMFMQTDSQQLDLGLCMDDSHIDHVAMETDSPRSTSPYIDVEKLSSDEDDMKQSPGSAVEEATQNQMVTLAKQIIAAMPERIKLSPGRGEEPSVEDIVDVRRSRSSSHSSFSSYSSSTTPPYAEDSGISTPLGDGLAFEEYRYADLGTPASSLSPASTCLQSPYSFNLDSPPATTADFIEYFNAPNIFMEKDFSQLTLSDSEQRKLYEAAKVIQSCYRLYKDKKQQQQQRQKEIEAAVLIQSYYRRYKQYAYYKKMTQAAVLIQSQFRSYSAQKRFKRRREAATVIQNQYRTYKEHERFKKSRNAAVIIQQKFRSHYQRKRSQEMARKMHQLVRQSSHSSEPSDIATAEGAQTTEAESQMRRKSADTLHPIPSQSNDQS